MDTGFLRKIRLDRTDPTPLYYQLGRSLEKMINDGTLRPGDRVPGTLQLGRALDINGETVNKAFSLLVDKHLIERQRKTGTFVTDAACRKYSNIGFFYLRESEIFMSKVAEHIQRTCTNFDLKIIPFDDDFYDKADLLQEVRRRDLTGAIFVALRHESCRRSLEALEKIGFPHIRLGNTYFAEYLKAPLIQGDNKRCNAEALEYLWKRGHRKIGLVYKYSRGETERDYLEFYAARGGLKKRWMMQVEFSGPPEKWKGFSTPGMVRDYLVGNRDITAIVVEAVPVCLDIIKSAAAFGRRVPEDLSLFCLVDWPGLDIITPPITAMHLPEKIFGEATGKLMVDILSGVDREGERLKVNFNLMERGSVRMMSSGNA